MPKSTFGFLICLVLTILLNLILIIPEHTEQFLSKAIKTKNNLIIPGMQYYIIINYLVKTI